MSTSRFHLAPLVYPGTALAELVRTSRIRRHGQNLLDDLARLLEEHGIAAGLIRRDVEQHPVVRLAFCVGRVAITTTTAWRTSTVRADLDRIADREDLDELVLVTTRPWHVAGLPASLAGKPLHIARR